MCPFMTTLHQCVSVGHSEVASSGLLCTFLDVARCTAVHFCGCLPLKHRVTESSRAWKHNLSRLCRTVFHGDLYYFPIILKGMPHVFMILA